MAYLKEEMLLAGICMGYLHRWHTVLGAVTNFSFLRGASHPHDMVNTAAEMGWQAIGIARLWHNGRHGALHIAAKQLGIKLLVGVCPEMDDSPLINDKGMNKTDTLFLKSSFMRAGAGYGVFANY